MADEPKDWKKQSPLFAAVGGTFQTKKIGDLKGLTKTEATSEPEALELTAPAWLTYETQFNHIHFRKPNCKSSLGVYAMPLSCCTIYLRRDLHRANSELLKSICQVFFPDLGPPDQVLKLLCSESPWRTDDKCGHSTPSTATPDSTALSRDAFILSLGPMVLMPYNVDENDSKSSAIGTDPIRADAPLILLDTKRHFLTCWHTASRSCIIELKSIVREDEMKEQRVDWPKVCPADALETWLFPASRPAPYDSKTCFSNSQLDPQKIFSVKMGVRYVGQVQQEGKKGVLGSDSLIGMLLSDYVCALREAGVKEAKWNKHLLLLTELLSVAEKPNKKIEDWEKLLDGFQLRDLTGMQPDCNYICPISIPYLGKSLLKRCGRYAEFDEERVMFWGEHFATAVGRAKAYLLIGYGLQTFTPNAQNFLIEFRGNAPTGRIVIRDLGDLKLHVGVAKAISDIVRPYKDYLKTQNLGHCTKFTRKQSEVDFNEGYPQGAHPHWCFYTSLAKGYDLVKEPTTLTDRQAHEKGWQKILAANGAWCWAHNRAYVTTIESALGIKIPIEWPNCPGPVRYEKATSESDAARLWKEDYTFETYVVAAAVDKALSENLEAIRDFAFK